MLVLLQRYFLKYICWVGEFNHNLIMAISGLISNQAWKVSPRREPERRVYLKYDQDASRASKHHPIPLFLPSQAVPDFVPESVESSAEKRDLSVTDV